MFIERPGLDLFSIQIHLRHASRLPPRRLIRGLRVMGH